MRATDSIPVDDPWSELRRRAAHHFAHIHGTRHGRGRGWPRFGPEDFARFGRGGRGFFGPGGPRAARGDIRSAILVLLLEQPTHGYQIIQELEKRSGGAWRASPGSVYPTLQQLEDEGLVRAVEKEAGRRVYELTDAGREEASKLAAGPAPWDEVAGSVGDDFAELRDLVLQLMAATWQVAHAGDAAVLTKAKEVLRDTRRQLYQLLADGSATSGKTEA
jgi:DNA-binding PadR family transcriptional regulator